MNKIKKIYKTSIDVFENCSFRNGAIVAANIKDPDYPENVKNYSYVWVRDASFVCVACDLLKMKRIPDRFFEWCWNAENFEKEGIFYMRYHVDGKMYGREFQPDQTGSLLWAIEHHSRHWNVSKFSELIEKAADGICSSWKIECFKRHYDLWEERHTSSRRKENFTYSVAMCVKGLESAIKLVGPKATWVKCRNQMEKEIEKAYDRKSGYFLRSFNGSRDTTIDSSIFGLFWPSEVINPNDFRMISTVKKIVETNVIENGGVIRYKGDRYAGSLRRKEGGAWPVLNFWLSIYYSELKKNKECREYVNWVMERVKDKLPEQIKNGKPISIIPLAWSHAMFIIAGKRLNLF